MSVTYDYKAIHVRESTKITELCDALDNLRYKVILEPVQVLDADDNLVTAYTVRVVSYFYGDEGIQVVPATGEPPIVIYDYDEAFNLYNKYVIDYKALLKAQTRDIQDIDIYREKIDYEDTCPRCCATCKWCKRFNSPDDVIFGREGKFECWNPANEREFDFDYKDENFPRPDPRFDKPSHFYGEKAPPHAIELEEATATKLHPVVQPLGVCKRYEVIEATPVPTPFPGESINSMINRKIDFKLSGAISSTVVPEVSAIVTPVVSAAVVGSVSSVIIPDVSAAVVPVVSNAILPEIGREIEWQLSNHFPTIEGNKGLGDYNGNGIDDYLEHEMVYDAGGAF